MTDPEFRAALAAHGLHPRPRDRRDRASSRRTSGAFSARAAQIEPQHRPLRGRVARASIPARSPGPALRRAWDRRAWAEARPDKVVPRDGAELAQRWIDELHDLGYRDPTGPRRGRRDAGRASSTATRVAEPGAHPARRAPVGVERRRHPRRGRAARSPPPASSPTPRSGASWPRTSPPAPSHACVPLLARDDVPEHVRSLTSPQVLAVEADLVTRLAARAEHAGAPTGRPRSSAGRASTRPSARSSPRWPATASCW